MRGGLTMRFDIRPRVRRAFRLALRGPDVSDREIEEELRTHVAFRAAQLVERGLTPAEAERKALSRLGGSWKETVSRLSPRGAPRASIR